MPWFTSNSDKDRAKIADAFAGAEKARKDRRKRGRGRRVNDNIPTDGPGWEFQVELERRQNRDRRNS